MTFEIFKDKREKWRWRLRATNGKIMANCGESFASKRNAERAAVAIEMGFCNKAARFKVING